jgi:hypothetical protein
MHPLEGMEYFLIEEETRDNVQFLSKESFVQGGGI